MKKKLLWLGVICVASAFTYNELYFSNAKAADENERVQLGDLQIEVHSIASHDKLVDGTGFIIEKPQSNNGEFVVIDATVTNTGLKQLELDAQLVYNLVTADGAVYEPTAIPFDTFFGVENINPKLSVTGQVAFEVPAGLNDFELLIETNEMKSSVPLP